MAVGTGLALLGSAAIGAAGSIIGGSKQSKAAKDAANISTQDNAANRAFLTDIYNRNAGALSPWQTSGATANNAIMELLGFPAQQQPQAFANYGQAPMPVNGYNGGGFSAPYNMGEGNYAGDPGMEIPFNGSQFAPTQYPPYAPPPGGVTNARSAFDTYRGATGYDFRFNEGVRGLQAAFSRNLDSGAAQKAAIRYGQGVGSDEFARYMALLGDQSRLGLSGASALAGVGQNYGQTVVAGNQSAATAQANARLYAGNAAAQNWANLGSSFGQALGGIKW